jgi:hypothetical protein
VKIQGWVDRAAACDLIVKSIERLRSPSRPT